MLPLFNCSNNDEGYTRTTVIGVPDIRVNKDGYIHKEDIQTVLKVFFDHRFGRVGSQESFVSAIPMPQLPSFESVANGFGSLKTKLGEGLEQLSSLSSSFINNCIHLFSWTNESFRSLGNFIASSIKEEWESETNSTSITAHPISSSPSLTPEEKSQLVQDIRTNYKLSNEVEITRLAYSVEMLIDSVEDHNTLIGYYTNIVLEGYGVAQSQDGKEYNQVREWMRSDAFLEDIKNLTT